MIFICVALGGGVGALARYGLSSKINGKWGEIPWGTFMCNLLGCFLIALFYRYNTDINLIYFTTTGMMGGFTTFSTFNYESAKLIKGKKYGKAFLYMVLSFTLCMAGIFAGWYI